MTPAPAPIPRAIEIDGESSPAHVPPPAPLAPSRLSTSSFSTPLLHTHTTSSCHSELRRRRRGTSERRSSRATVARFRTKASNSFIARGTRLCAAIMAWPVGFNLIAAHIEFACATSSFPMERPRLRAASLSGSTPPRRPLISTCATRCGRSCHVSVLHRSHLACIFSKCSSIIFPCVH